MERVNIEVVKLTPEDGSFVHRFKNLQVYSKNGLETKISRTFLDFLHVGNEFFFISGHGAYKNEPS